MTPPNTQSSSTVSSTKKYVFNGCGRQRLTFLPTNTLERTRSHHVAVCTWELVTGNSSIRCLWHKWVSDTGHLVLSSKGSLKSVSALPWYHEPPLIETVFCRYKLTWEWTYVATLAAATEETPFFGPRQKCVRCEDNWLFCTIRHHMWDDCSETILGGISIQLDWQTKYRNGLELEMWSRTFSQFQLPWCKSDESYPGLRMIGRNFR